MMPSSSSSSGPPGPQSSDSQVPGVPATAGPLRRLLPAGAGETTPGPLPLPVSMTPGRPAGPLRVSTLSPAPGPSPPPVPRPAPLVARTKRQATTAACGACRKRKSKCNGERPKCSACRDRGTDCCFDTRAAETHAQALKRKFNELQSQKSAYEHIYEILQARPLKEAEDVFQRIRKGADAGSILRHVSCGDVLIQLALVPEARYRYEFPYRSEMPVFLEAPDNPYLDSEIYSYVLRSSPSPASAHHSERRLLPAVTDTPSPSVTPDPGEDYQRDPYLKPYHAASVIHPCLDTVKPSEWTSVSSDDTLMRKFLHDYFLYEHGWNTFVHMDLLLDDMANKRHRFCSELLVNAILCVGCYHHRGLRERSEHWNPKNIGYSFLAEAKRLYEIDSELERPPRPPHGSTDRKYRQWEQRRLVTIQAALLLNTIHIFNGSDKIGWRYMRQAMDMARELQLFQTTTDDVGFELRAVRDRTAWALFIWQSVNCYHNFRTPLAISPPASPLPDPVVYPQWYGEIWVKYPLSVERLPTHHGHMLKAKADLAVIMNDFALFSFGTSDYHRLSVDQILVFYNRLKAWWHNLPGVLAPRSVAMPHPMKLHMHYHLILINILKPIVPYSWDDGRQPLGIIPAESPREAYRNASIHMETLIRLYYLRHGFEAMDSFLMQFLGILAQMTIETINTNTNSGMLEYLRSTLILAMKGLFDQGRSLYVARAVLHLMHLHSASLRAEDVELLRKFAEIDVDEEVYAPLEQPVQSDWPTYVIGYDENPDSQRLGKSLMNRLESLSLDLTAPPATLTARLHAKNTLLGSA